MTNDQFRKLAMSFPGTAEQPHFDRAAFKLTGKRIFATLHEESGTANLRLPANEQPVFCSFHKNAVYPVPNKWGLQGWTTFVLGHVPEGLMLDALNTAYQDVFKPGVKKK